MEEGEFVSGEMCGSMKAAMRMLAADEDKLAMVALFCECGWVEMVG